MNRDSVTSLREFQEERLSLRGRLSPFVRKRFKFVTKLSMERRPAHQTPEAPRAGDHDIESESKRPRSPPSPVLASMGVGNKLALASVGVLLVWTALLCLGAYLFGVNFGQTAVLPPPRRPQGLSSGPSRSLLGAETDEVERRWTDKLIGDLQSSASDETVSATLSELRETLSAREERLEQLGAAARRTPTASGASPAAAAASAASSVTVPRYDRNSVAELQQAAMAAALPSEVRGPLPQLVRDLGAALARQQTEHEALKKKLLQLQPAVINYDKKSTEQLTKAVLQATAGTSGAPDGGGALPRLLKDLAAQLAVQEEEQEKQKKALELETTKKARTARRAAALKALLLKTSPKVEERAALLFDELADRTTLAIEDATKGYEQPEGKSSSWSTDEKKEEAARWQDSLSEVRALVLDERPACTCSPRRLAPLSPQVRALVLDEFKAAADRNASLGLAYEGERAKRLALEANVSALEKRVRHLVHASAHHDAPSTSPQVSALEKRVADLLTPPPPPPPAPPPPLPVPTTAEGAMVGTSALPLQQAVWAMLQQARAEGASAAATPGTALPRGAEGGSAAATTAPLTASATAGAAPDTALRGAVTPAVEAQPEAEEASAAVAAADNTTPNTTQPLSALASALASVLASTASSSPPPPPAAAAAAASAGVCAGKSCPSGYQMIDRGDRCTCRPLS